MTAAETLDHLALLDALAEDHEDHADEDVELDLVIMEGRRNPSRPVPIRRMARRAASPTARRRYERAAAHRRALKLWSALRTSPRGGRCRRRLRVRRRVARGGVGDDPDGPARHRTADQRRVGRGNKNLETPASSASPSRSKP